MRISWTSTSTTARPRRALVPDAYCHIIRNCADNAAALAPRLACIVAATGPEKCDGGSTPRASCAIGWMWR